MQIYRTNHIPSQFEVAMEMFGIFSKMVVISGSGIQYTQGEANDS